MSEQPPKSSTATLVILGLTLVLYIHLVLFGVPRSRRIEAKVDALKVLVDSLACGEP